MRKRVRPFFFTLIVIVIYIFSQPAPAYAEAGDGGEPKEILHAIINISLPFFLQAGESPNTLPLEPFAYAYYERFKAVECNILWRFNKFDNVSPGRRVIIGDVVLPDGYVYPGGELTVECIVIVYDDSGAPFIRLTNCAYTNFNLPIVLSVGTEPEEVARIFDEAIGEHIDFARCYTEYGDGLLVPFTLDISVVDTSRPGVYYPVTLDLPGGITFGGQEAFLVATHVLPVDEVVLSAFGRTNLEYIVPWTYEAREPELWVAIDDGGWRRQSGYFDLAYGGLLYPDKDGISGLLLPFLCFEAGHVYRFQVQYDENRFSDVLVLDFTSDTVPKVTNAVGGDRGGIDREESDSPSDYSQPPDGGGMVFGGQADGEHTISPSMDTSIVEQADKTPGEETSSVPAKPAARERAVTLLSEASIPQMDTQPDGLQDGAQPPVLQTGASGRLEMVGAGSGAASDSGPNESIVFVSGDAAPYHDSFVPIAIACGFGIACTAAYIGFSLKRRMRR